MTERKALGRGLSSLIPNYRPLPPDPNSLDANKTAGILQAPMEVAISSIRVNPLQPRRHFSESGLEELGQSIQKAGILQPLIVRPVDQGYELIAGERRYRAAKRIGLTHVPVMVRKGNDQTQLEIALIENLQREDLNPIEEAAGYDRLNREFSLTQEEIADKVGKKRSTVSNLLRLLKLPSSVREMVSKGCLSMGHARALLSLENHHHLEILARKIESQGLSVRQVEAMVRKFLQPAPTSNAAKNKLLPMQPNIRHVTEELQRSLGTRVQVLPKGKGGEIRIQFFNAEDFKRIRDRLLA